MTKNFLSLFFLLFALSLPASVQSDEMEGMQKMSAELKAINNHLSRGQFKGKDLTAWTKLTIKMKSAASLCVSNNEAALLELKAVIDGLGEKVKGEDAEVTKKRAAYLKEKESLDKTLAKCNLYIASSKEVADLINASEKSYFKKKYLAKSPDMIQLLYAYMANPVAIVKESGEFIFMNSGVRDIDTADLILSVMAVLLSIFFGLWLRRKLLALESRRHWKDEFSERLLRAVMTTLATSVPYLLGSAVAALSSVIITLEVAEVPFVTEFFIGLLLFFLASTTIRLLFAPSAPAELFISFTPHIAESLARRLKVLSVLGLIGYLAFYTVFSKSIVESNLLLLRNVFSLFFVVNIVWTLRVIIKSPRLPRLRYLSVLVIIAVSMTLVAEWMGYRNLAFTGRQVIISSFVVFILFVGLSKLFRDLFNAIDEARTPGVGVYIAC